MFIWHTNKIIRYSLIITLLLIGESNAQSITIDVNIGLGTYTYNDLRDYQEYIQNQIPVNSTITEEFPPFLIYSVAICKQIKTWEIGIEAGHGSTGGRIYYEDYSGEFIADQLISYTYLSISPGAIFIDKNKFSLIGKMKVMANFNNLKINNSLQLGGQTSKEDQDFGSVGFGLQPNLIGRRYFKQTFIQISCGYELQTKSKPTTKDNDHLFLAGENNEPVYLQGSGLRAMIGLGVRGWG
jgi:hypothetical protein